MVPHNFVFSQNNLQMYIDCKRLFYLHEIEHLQWPAIESEPVKLQEERMAVGSKFHLLCSQYLFGIPGELLHESIDSDEMLRWWNSFLQLGLQPAANIFPEKAITIPFAGFRLTAHFDVLVKNADNSYTIFDWKTNRNQPKREIVEKRMQTLVYPVVLNNFINSGKTLPPPAITMVYWYPEFPDKEHKFIINSEKINNDQQVLEKNILEISEYSSEDFMMTDNEKRCQICSFRSYCNRGSKAGEISESDLLDEQISLV